LPESAADLVSRKVDLIASLGATHAALAAKIIVAMHASYPR
jgi:hypothetical protein